MTSVHDLSHDLVEEILSRVTMTSLGAMRSTCKLWNTLSKDPSFKNCSKAAKENMVVMMYGFEARLMSVNLHNPQVDPFIKQIGKLKQVKICEIFHCSGLLLCVTFDHKTVTFDHKISRLVVWNPYSGQTRRIQLSNKYLTSIFGMGYDSNNNHKISKFPYWHGQIDYEIYDFKLNSWRVLDVSIKRLIYGPGVSLKGNSYFITQNIRWEVGEEEESENCLLCFDFTRERFWDLPLPCHGRAEDTVLLSVVREEKLAVLFKRFDALEMEIWITNKIEPNAVSWSYFLKVDKISSIKFRYLRGSFFIDEKKRVAVIYDRDWTPDANYKACMVGEGGYYKEVDLGESRCPPIMCSHNYVPSSLKI